jgi:hypothetical protein
MDIQRQRTFPDPHYRNNSRLISSFENDGKKRETNSYLHGHIKHISSHPFRVGTSHCPWMARHRWMPVPGTILMQVDVILRPPVPVLVKV